MSAVLAIDVGGTHVKMRTSASEERREFESGPMLTATAMAEGVKRLTSDWSFDRATIGLPTPIVDNRPAHEPVNLGAGWVDFDFQAACGVPTKLINDAAMQAVGSYAGGRMLFLGLGTGLGSCFIVDHRIVPMELAHLPYRKGRTFEDYVGLRGMERLGKKSWRKHVSAVASILGAALLPDEIVFGGGNAQRLKELPPHCRLGDNTLAFIGGFRLWEREWMQPAPHRADSP